MYYNRYKDFTQNGEIKTVPYITLADKPSDKYVVYKLGKTRMDKLSQQYYGTPYFGWLILQGNQKYGSQEWNIPDGAIITVPFPLMQSLQDYKTNLDQYFLYYGR